MSKYAFIDLAGAANFRPAAVLFNQSPIRIKIAQEPHIIGPLGPKALNYESFEGSGRCPKP